ncbi:glycosyltransferase family 2 protein [Brevundimonas sp.]|uniref:glycosyltransferase family 2 protein n=1 Tax=Brevundimonas sp. TaxID=1871086 RepID=UPI00356460F8
MTRFEVVAMALAPDRHIAVFVDHYRRKGAARVRVYFDGAAEAAPRPADVGLGDEALIVCDDAFWARRGGRPTSVEARQRRVYKDAYDKIVADWLVVVDIDELIHCDASLDAVLSAAPASRDLVIFPTVEAVWRVGDDLDREYGARFARKAYSGLFWSELSYCLYPGAGAFFVRGLLGHHMGKYAVRRGKVGVTACIHEAKQDGAPLKAVSARDPLNGRPVWLLHYDAISLDAWRAKWDRRLETGDTIEIGRRRRRQQMVYAKARETGHERALFARLYSLTNLQIWVLRRLGLLLDIKVGDRATRN